MKTECKLYIKLLIAIYIFFLWACMIAIALCLWNVVDNKILDYLINEWQVLVSITAFITLIGLLYNYFLQPLGDFRDKVLYWLICIMLFLYEYGVWMAWWEPEFLEVL